VRSRHTPAAQTPKDRALSEHELQQIERLLGDPVVYPAAFKNWINAWIEDNPPNIPWTNLRGIPDSVYDTPATLMTAATQSSEGVAVPPIGSVYLWPTEFAPANHLACNGAAVSRTDYADLFATIGTSQGMGDGSTTFNLPSPLSPPGMIYIIRHA
jgi:Phage Tail Collar Domain